MGQVLELPKNELMEMNNRCRDLALELHMQGNLLEHLDPAGAILTQGKAQGLLLACNIIMEAYDA